VVFLLDLIADSMYFGGFLSPSLCMPKEAWRQRCLQKTREKAAMLQRLGDAFAALKPDPSQPGSGKVSLELSRTLSFVVCVFFFFFFFVCGTGVLVLLWVCVCVW
jgi:hypothetical protein